MFFVSVTLFVCPNTKAEVTNNTRYPMSRVFALVSTARWAASIAGKPFLHVMKMAAMCTALAPGKQSFDREMATNKT